MSPHVDCLTIITQEKGSDGHSGGRASEPMSPFVENLEETPECDRCIERTVQDF